MYLYSDAIALCRHRRNRTTYAPREMRIAPLGITRARLVESAK